MPDFTVKRTSEMATRYGGSFEHPRAEIGVTSFGMEVIDFPRNADRYPEHEITAATARRRSMSSSHVPGR